MDNNLITSNY